MALERQTVAVPFAGGIDTKTDSRQVEPGKATALVNAVFSAVKSVRKRWGYAAKTAPTAPTFSAVSTAATGRGQVLLSDGATARVGDGSTWTESLNFPHVRVSRGGLLNAADNVTSADIAYGPGDTACQVWAEATKVYLRIYSTASGAELLTKTLWWTGTGVMPAGRGPVVRALLVDGTTFLVLAGDNDSAVWATYSNAGASLASGTLASGMGLTFTAMTVDACQGDGTSAFIVYAKSTTEAAARRFASGSMSAELALGLALAGEDVSHVGAGYSAGDATPYGVAVITTTGTPHVYRVVTTMASPPVIVQAKLQMGSSSDPLTTPSYLTGLSSGDGGYVTWTEAAATSGTLPATGVIRARAMGGPGASFAAGGPLSSPIHCKHASRPFRWNGDTVAIVRPVDGGSAYFLVQLAAQTQNYVLARFAATDGYPTGQRNLFSVTQPSAGVAKFLPLVVTGTRSTQGRLASIVGASEYTLTGPELASLPGGQSVMSTALAGSLFLGDGMLWQYDGRTLCESGFHLYPGVIDVAVTGASGGLDVGDYQWCALYEWTDGAGAVHRSQASAVVTQTVAASPSYATVLVPTLRLTAKDASSVRVVLFRTEANGTIFYRVDSGQANDPAANYVTFTDTAADSDITGNEQLYTTGGVLENEPPPNVAALTVYRNRLLALDAENPTTVWMSKQVVPGSPVEWSSFLTKSVDPVGGDLTALAVLDDKLVLFKESGTYYTTGEGPAPTGVGDDMGTPMLINTNSGCIQPRSVITAGDGVLYASKKGLMLLARSLDDQYVGAEVEAYNATSLQGVVGTDLLPDRNEARIVCSDGTILIWDYLLKQWGTAALPVTPRASTVLNGEHWVVGGPDATLLAESVGTFTDAGGGYSLSVTTAWLAAAELGGYQRVYELVLTGETSTGNGLTVSIFYDYDDTTAEDHDFNPGGSGSFRCRIRPARQKSGAIKIKVTEWETPTESDLQLSALTLVVGAKRGAAKLPSSASV